MTRIDDLITAHLNKIDDFSNLAVGTSLVLATTLAGTWDDPDIDPADTFVTADVAGRRWGLCAMTSGTGAGGFPLVFSSTGAAGSVSWVVKEVVREDLGMVVGAFATHVANVELVWDGRIKYVNNATNVYLTGLHVLGDEVKFTITRVTDTTHNMSIVVNDGTPTIITNITNAGTRNWRAGNPVTALTLVLPIIGTFYITDITASWLAIGDPPIQFQTDPDVDQHALVTLVETGPVIVDGVVRERCYVDVVHADKDIPWDIITSLQTLDVPALVASIIRQTKSYSSTGEWWTRIEVRTQR